MRKLILTLTLLLMTSPALGQTLAKFTVCPSGCDYSSLETALNANEQDLVTNDKNLEIEISGDWTSGADTNVVTIHNYTTDATRDIYIYTVGDAVHDGTWTTSAYRLEASSDFGAIFIVESKNVTIEGIQVNNTSVQTADPYTPGGMYLASGSDPVTLDKVISSAPENGIFIASFGGTFTIKNSIGISRWNDSSRVGTAIFAGYATANIYNSAGIHHGQGGAIHGSNVQGTITCVNCYGYSATGTVYDEIDTLTTSASSDTTGSAGLQSVAFSTSSGGYFTNVTSNSEDLHIKADSDLRGAGTDSSGTFTDDIDGDTRSAWDVGPDEYQTAGGGGGGGDRRIW